MKNLQNCGMHHVGFVVKDLDATIEHFKAYYGIESLPAYPFTPSRVWSYGKEVFGYQLKIAMVIFENGSAIELIQPLKGEGVHKDFIDAGNNGMHHIGFSVDNYDYWHEYFLKKNAEIVFESETEDDIYGYRRCFYANDSIGGMIYEIKENPYFRKK